MQRKLGRYQKIVELSTWVIMIIVIFGVRFLPIKLIDNDQVYYLIGAILAFALLYYLIIYRYFSPTNRFYLKTVADIVLIGILIHVLKDFGNYFFALYFLPIAAAALELEFINALLIAMIASIFVAFEVVLGSQQLLAETGLYQGIWQIGLILLMTIFCRALALQIRQERSAKEEALARQKILEEEANRNKEFLSLTSHQLYTPLSIIRGFVAMLNEGKMGKLSDKQKDAVSEIYANAKRMVNLVTELLSISRIQAGTFELKLQRTNISGLINNIVKQFQDTNVKKEVEIVAKISGPEKEITIDGDKIRSVIYNLIDNALKYTGRGKVIVTCEQQSFQVKISVTDEGVGIKNEDFDKLFQPFFRGKNILELDNSGTGLGLYISRLIVEKHGGKIWAENNPKAGATFAFNLPNK